jgi:hypothetical protein
MFDGKDGGNILYVYAYTFFSDAKNLVMENGFIFSIFDLCTSSVQLSCLAKSKSKSAELFPLPNNGFCTN